jgi:hypothetical protein
MFTVYVADSVVVESSPANLVSIPANVNDTNEKKKEIGFEWNRDVLAFMATTKKSDEDAAAAGVKIGMPFDQLESVTVLYGNQVQILDGFTSVRSLSVLGEEDKDEESNETSLQSLQRLTTPTTLWATFLSEGDSKEDEDESSTTSSSSSSATTMELTVRGQGSSANIVSNKNISGSEISNNLDVIELPFTATGYHRHCGSSSTSSSSSNSDTTTTTTTNNAVVARQYELPTTLPLNDDHDIVWRYDHGLLVADKKNDDNDDGSTSSMCLGLDTSSSYGKTYLKERSCKPYVLALQDCPSDANDDEVVDAISSTNNVRTLKEEEEDDDDDDDVVASSRHLRFLLKEHGQSQALVPVYDRYGNDVRETKPYCLTVVVYEDEDDEEKKSNQAYLKPCLDKDDDDDDDDDENNNGGGGVFDYYHKYFGKSKKVLFHEQFFDMNGTSEPFLMPLQSSWGYDDEVELAYHVGLGGDDNKEIYDSSSSSSYYTIDFSIVSSSSSSTDINDKDDTNQVLVIVDSIDPTTTNSGVVTFVPSDHNVSGGPVTATFLTTVTTTFAVEEDTGHVKRTCGGYSSWQMSASSNVRNIVLGFLGAAAALTLLALVFGKSKKNGRRKASSTAAASTTVATAAAPLGDEEDGKTMASDDDDDESTRKEEDEYSLSSSSLSETM